MVGQILVRTFIAVNRFLKFYFVLEFLKGVQSSRLINTISIIPNFYGEWIDINPGLSSI
jgi:hypothetical protein